MKYVTGVAELDRQLNRIATRDARRLVRNGVNKGLTVLAKAIRTEAPKGRTGNLRKGIGKRFRKNRRSGEMEAIAGIGVGKKKRAAHIRIVALGSKPRVTKAGAYRGVMPANDFVTRAASRVGGNAQQTVLLTVRHGLENLTK